MLHVTKLKRGRNSLGPLLFSVLYFKVTIMSVWTQVHVLGCSHLAVEYFWVVWARGGGRGTAIHGLYRYVPLRRVWFLSSLL